MKTKKLNKKGFINIWFTVIFVIVLILGALINFGPYIRVGEVHTDVTYDLVDNRGTYMWKDNSGVARSTSVTALGGICKPLAPKEIICPTEIVTDDGITYERNDWNPVIGGTYTHFTIKRAGLFRKRHCICPG